MEIDYSLILRVENATMTNYNKFKAGDEKTRLINKDEIENMFEDLLNKIESLEKEIDYMREDVRENYKRIPVEDQYE